MVFKQLTRSCVELSWAWIVYGFPLVFAKKWKYIRLAICDSEIRDFRFGIWTRLRPLEILDTEKNWHRQCPFQVFEKPKILNQTIAFCYGFQKTDAKLCGAIVGLDPLRFSIGFCKNLKIHPTCDLRFGNSGFPVWNLDTIATPRNPRHWKNWHRQCPFQVFEKPKILNQTIAFWSGFQKTDAKLCGAIVGLDRLRFSIGFCKKTKKYPPWICHFRLARRQFGN